jgi:hypothetical protein
MSKHDEKLEQKSSAKFEISGPLDDKDLEKVSGGDSTVVQHEQVTGQREVGVGLRKSAGNTASGVLFIDFMPPTPPTK